ncbi:MAG: DUF302 domain-containing protein [Dechloromonas sp.]|nr:DUF302 domain-containing protein [Dechloromonas sp.]
MVSTHLFGTPLGASRFFLVLLLLISLSGLSMASDAHVVKISASDFRTAHDGLIEAIESEGLVVGSILPFRDMLARTAVGDGEIPYAHAEIVQFCSGQLAAELVREAPAQLTLCPLSIAVYTLPQDRSIVWMAYRLPGTGTSGRQRAELLLQRVIKRAAELSRLRW